MTARELQPLATTECERCVSGPTALLARPCGPTRRECCGNGRAAARARGRFAAMLDLIPADKRSALETALRVPAGCVDDWEQKPGALDGECSAGVGDARVGRGHG